MAVRSENAHWKMRDILRRHSVALGERHGILTEAGRDVELLIDDVVARTPAVIATVRAALPQGYPASVADGIFEGLQDAPNRLHDDH